MSDISKQRKFEFGKLKQRLKEKGKLLDFYLICHGKRGKKNQIRKLQRKVKDADT
jgi:hypothetical protein